MKRARVFAFYLPQFHPIPENDKWWGKGFTEWTNVGKAKKLFPGHYQPHVPADLGYYDLRVSETREAQAEMAKKYGVDGFIYWHYWFGNGKRLLERPFEEVLKSGKPDFPFALAWANETWKGFAHGLTNRNVLISQSYPGDDDYIAHFYKILPALKDYRYITVDNKPIFIIYKPFQLPNANHFIQLWQSLALKNGLKGIYFIAHHNKENNLEEEKKYIQDYINMGFDSVNFVRLNIGKISIFYRVLRKISRLFFDTPLILDYKKVMQNITNENDMIENVIPSLMPNWDHTPRSGKEGLVLRDSRPEYFAETVQRTLSNVINKPLDKRLIFIKSWNEWAEGNYMEPDLIFGTKYLEKLSSIIFEKK